MAMANDLDSGTVWCDKTKRLIFVELRLYGECMENVWRLEVLKVRPDPRINCYDNFDMAC